jgi:nitric oxide reductase activation protein
LRFPRGAPAVLLLLDLSESLNAIAPGSKHSGLAVARTASALLARSLARIAPDFAIHGFSSNGRHDVEYCRLKDFGHAYDTRAKAALAGMRAGRSTRLGAALRHAGAVLGQRRATRKLILVVTDGEPSDVDVHDESYLVFDAKQASAANRARGITSFCVGLDPKAEPQIQRIFGAHHYLLLEKMEALPQQLSRLYLKLSA